MSFYIYYIPLTIVNLSIGQFYISIMNLFYKKTQGLAITLVTPLSIYPAMESSISL